MVYRAQAGNWDDSPWITAGCISPRFAGCAIVAREPTLQPTWIGNENRARLAARRPRDPAWARDLREQCLVAGVPFSFKQWGGRNKKAAGRELDGRLWDERPEARAQRQGRRVVGEPPALDTRGG